MRKSTAFSPNRYRSPLNPWPEERAEQRRASSALRHRNLIPDPCRSYEEAERFRHADIGSLTRTEAYAEEVLLTAELAEQIFQRFPDVGISGGEITAREWIEQRLRHLKAITQPRKTSVAA